VHHDDDGKAARALRDTKLAGDRDRRAVGVAVQELLVRNGERGDRMNLDPGGRFRWDRLALVSMQVTSTPVQKSAAVTAKRQSDGMTFPPSSFMQGNRSSVMGAVN
jgi:hypothetical protein